MTDSTYHAASQGRRLHIWRPPNAGPNASIVRELSTIRSRHRAAVRNDPWAGAVIEKRVANAIGTGVQAKMVNGSEEEKAAVKRLWNAWTKVCDADGVLEFEAIQGLGWQEWDEAGEVFVRFRTRRMSDGLPVPLQLQLIEAEQCPAEFSGVASNGNQIRAGIEFDAIGRRVAYWMYRSHPTDAVMMAPNSTELVRVPADQVIHLYRPLRAGQLRGIPGAVSTLVKAFNLDSLDDAVLERQKIANLYAMFYTKSIDPESEEAIVDEMSRGADDEQELDEDDTPLAGLEPGTAQELPPGVTPQFSNPPAPGNDYSEFLRSQLLAIAARRGVPYEVLTGDLRNVSDRALKLILNEFRRVLEMDQWLFFIPTFCQRVRERFFDMGVLSGALEFDDYEGRREELIETLWVPQGWPYSHPVQDVVADIKAIRAGLQSRDGTILARGEDPEKVDDEIVAGNARADERGLVLDSDPRKTSSAGGAQTGSSAHSAAEERDGNADQQNGNEEQA